jgi:hypothetical protein
VSDDADAAATRDVGQDGPVRCAEVTPEATDKYVRRVERAVLSIVGPVVALPLTELSGFGGYPLIRWSETLSDRLANGHGPMLDRPTLSLWESPSGTAGAPPAPLTIVGFASAGCWPHALRAARQLRGFGAGCVLTSTRPSTIKLLEADYAGVHVIRLHPQGSAEVLVSGSRGALRPPRMVATRYWEERLLAHALTLGFLTLPPSMAKSEPIGPETLWAAKDRQ